MSSKSLPANASYHHGDLRNALVDAAITTMSEQGHTQFSLSELARGLGVTPAAAYKHFADKQALLYALAQIGFERLSERFELAAPAATSARSASDAKTRFKRIGQAYVAFGVDEPALFNLMFGKSGADYRKAATANTQRTTSFSYLALALEDLHRFDVIARMPKAEDQWFAWSAIHGATELAIAGITSMVSVERASTVVTAQVIQALR